MSEKVSISSQICRGLKLYNQVASNISNQDACKSFNMFNKSGVDQGFRENFRIQHKSMMTKDKLGGREFCNKRNCVYIMYGEATFH